VELNEAIKAHENAKYSYWTALETFRQADALASNNAATRDAVLKAKTLDGELRTKDTFSSMPFFGDKAKWTAKAKEAHEASDKAEIIKNVAKTNVDVTETALNTAYLNFFNSDPVHPSLPHHVGSPQSETLAKTLELAKTVLGEAKTRAHGSLTNLKNKIAAYTYALKIQEKKDLEIIAEKTRLTTELGLAKDHAKILNDQAKAAAAERLEVETVYNKAKKAAMDAAAYASVVTYVPQERLRELDKLFVDMQTAEKKPAIVLSELQRKRQVLESQKTPDKTQTQPQTSAQPPAQPPTDAKLSEALLASRQSSKLAKQSDQFAKAKLKSAITRIDDSIDKSIVNVEEKIKALKSPAVTQTTTQTDSNTLIAAFVKANEAAQVAVGAEAKASENVRQFEKAAKAAAAAKQEYDDKAEAERASEKLPEGKSLDVLLAEERRLEDMLDTLELEVPPNPDIAGVQAELDAVQKAIDVVHKDGLLSKNMEKFKGTYTGGANTSGAGAGAKNAATVPPPDIPHEHEHEHEHDPDVAQKLADVEKSIALLQSNVRKAFSELKRQLALAYTSTTTRISKISVYTHGHALPRIKFLKQNIEDMVYKYLDIHTSVVGKLALQGMGGGKSTSKYKAAHRPEPRFTGKLTKGAIVGYKLSDERTRIMYALKLLRFGGQMLALWVAQQAYLEEYGSAVYRKDARPPQLTRMLVVFLSIDATLQLLTLGMLVLTSYIMVDKTASRNQAFVINDAFIRDFLAEYFVTTASTAALGALLGGVVHRRVFFEFQKTGKHGVDMYRMMLIAVCAVVGIVPFFLCF